MSVFEYAVKYYIKENNLNESINCILEAFSFNSNDKCIIICEDNTDKDEIFVLFKLSKLIFSQGWGVYYHVFNVNLLEIIKEADMWLAQG